MKDMDAGPPPPSSSDPPDGAGDADPTGPTGQDEPGSASVSAWRLTFEYEDEDVRLVDRQPVHMVAPPDDAALVEQGEEGYWVEVRDADDRPLYQQVLNRPVQTEFEVHSPDPGAMPTHVDAPRVRGVFQVVVPDLPHGTSVAVQGSTVGPMPGPDAGSDEDSASGAASGVDDPDAAPPDRRRGARRATARTLVVAALRNDGAVPPEEQEEQEEQEEPEEPEGSGDGHR